MLRARYHLEVVPHRDELEPEEREKSKENDSEAAESPHPPCPGLLPAGYQGRNQKHGADEVADLQEQQRCNNDPSGDSAPKFIGFPRAFHLGHRLGVEDGTLAVVGGTDVFALFLSIGYDAFFLTRALASVPRGRPVFPGVGHGVAAEEPLKQRGLVLCDTRMLDPVSETVVQEWGPQR